MRANPKPCLQTDEISDDEPEWKSVIAFGEFDEVKNSMERQRHLDRFYKAFPRFTSVEAKLDKKEASGDVVIFRINMSRMTGLAEILLTLIDLFEYKSYPNKQEQIQI